MALNEYLQKYPNTDRAMAAQLEYLIGQMGDTEDVLQEAVKRNIAPDDLLKILTRGPQPEEPYPSQHETRADTVPSEKPKRGWFQNLRERFGKPNRQGNKHDPQQTTSRNRLGGLSETVKKSWWLIIVLALIGGAIAYFRTGHIIKPPVIAMHGNAHLTIPMLSLGLGLLFLFSLLESTARHDPLLLDFFAPWILVAILVAGQVLGHDSPWFWLPLGAALFAMVIATFYNPSEEGEEGWWNRIDTTNWYVAGVALIFIYLMNSEALPYPSYLPIVMPILVAAVAMGKEIFRQPIFSLIAIAIGIVPAITQNIIWIAIGLAIEVTVAAIGARQGWITARGTQHTIGIGGRNLEFIMSWDLVLFYVIEVVLIGFALYKNYPIFTIGK